MNRPDLLIETAILATREKLEDKVLSCGKIKATDSSRNFVFYLIELDSPEESNVVRKITQVLSNSAKTVEELSENVFERMLELTNETLGRLSQTNDNAWIGHLNAVIGLVIDDNILICQAGNITGYIFRKNKISSLTEQVDPETITHPKRTFTDITSGQIALDDQIIFGNNDLFNHVSVDRLRSFIKLNDVKTEVFELNKYLKKAKIISANAIFIEAGNELKDPDTADVMFVDDAEETLVKSIGKEMIPVLEKIWRQIQKASIFLYKNALITSKKLKKSWDEKYAPQSKKLFEKSQQEFAKTIEKTKNKIASEIETKQYPHIKAVPYSKIEKKKTIFDQLKKFDFSKIGKIFEKNNRKFVYIVILIIVLSIGYAKIKENNDKRSEKIKQVQVASAYDQAKDIFKKAKEDLLLGKTTDLSKFYEALDLANKAKENKANEENAIKLIKDINTILDEKTATVRIYDTAGFAISDNTTNIALAGSEIYGINSDLKVYLSDTRDKTSKLIGSISKDNGAISDASYSKSKASIIFGTNAGKVFSLDIASKTIEELKNTETDGLWQGKKAIATYSSNIYTLDPEKDTIWKYVLKDIEYAKGTAYNNKKASIKNAVDMAVDGNVFVLLGDGSVLKFVKGAAEADFAVKGIPAPNDKIAEPTKIFTDEDTNSIFILDKAQNRIVKFDKSGDFANQYIFDGITIESFVVNAKLQKIWALSAGKIYEGSL